MLSDLMHKAEERVAINQLKYDMEHNVGAFDDLNVKQAKNQMLPRAVLPVILGKQKFKKGRTRTLMKKHAALGTRIPEFACDPDAAETKSGMTPLHFATLMGRKDIVEILVEEGCVPWLPLPCAIAVSMPAARPPHSFAPSRSSARVAISRSTSQRRKTNHAATHARTHAQHRRSPSPPRPSL